MCGFVGYFGKIDSVSSQQLRRALDAIAHRGPDDEGINCYEEANGELCLAHKRLSIIDLSSNGHQPFSDESGRYSIVYNGEVYNYRELRTELINCGHKFFTDTDTEVVLESWKAWGTNALKKFIGMFSIVIYDKHNQQLSLIRDAFGIKPLYFSIEKDNFYFASEIPSIKELISNKFSINENRLCSYIVMGDYDYGSETFFNEINQLEPAHCVTYDLKNRKLGKSQIWWWPSIEENRKLTIEEASSNLRSLFIESIRLHLRSDVPLGVALSGGVDSSAVTCAVRYIDPELTLKTFSFIAKDSPLSEEKWVDLINEYTKSTPNKVYVKGDEIIKDLEDLVRTLGEPFGSTSIYAQYRVFKLIKEKGVTVTLDGQGADELLAGYSGYPKERVSSLLADGEIISALSFLYRWSRWPDRGIKRAFTILFKSIFPKSFISRLIIKKHGLKPNWINYGNLKKPKEPLGRSKYKIHPIQKNRQLVSALRTDLISGGLQSLLRHGDRNSMRWSVESRVPFLTIPLVEFILSLPESYLVSPDGRTKNIFKLAMKGIVPDSILDRRDKIGFSTPEGEWIKQIDKSYWIKPQIIRSIPYLKADLLIKDLENQLTGKTKWKSQSWRIINYLKWHEINHF
jgi:asparagine synthase (glutamine-hydrolysing)